MTNVNCDLPDLLLCYSPGCAGRLLVHLVMLSPEVHTWSPEEELLLNALPLDQHAEHKLSFIEERIFPKSLKENIGTWKAYEPQPWGLEFPKTKKFIRHAWMMPGVKDIERFGCSKVVYVDYTRANYFALRAVVSKRTYGLTTPRMDLPPGDWYKADTEEETIKIVVSQLLDMDRILLEWKATSNYALNLNQLLFSSDDSFLNEYLALCKFYEITPAIEQAHDLRAYWLALQWKRENSTHDFVDEAFRQYSLLTTI